MPVNTSLGIQVLVDAQNALQGFQKVDAALAGLSLSVLAVGKNLSSVAAEFDKNMRNVNSIAQESEDNFKKMSDQLRQLTDDPKIKDGPSNLSKGMYQLISSGFDASQSLEMVAVASKAASAGLTTTEVSVTALSALMNAYNKKTLQDSINFSDQLFKVVDKGVVNFEQLATNLGEVSAVASAAGVDFKEIGAAFIELTKAGVGVSESQTAIAGLIRALATPSPEALKFAKLLGVDIGELAIKTKGVSGVLNDLNKATGGSITLMQKFIPEVRSATAGLTLSKNSAEGFKNSINDMTNSLGSNNKALSQQVKAADFSFQKMKQSIENLKIEYGNLINEALVPILKEINYFINLAKNLDNDTKKLIIQTGLWTVALTSALFVIKGLIAALNLLAANPFLLRLAVIVGFFVALNNATEELKNSTDAWSQSLAEVLKYIDLINLGKQLYNKIEAERQEKESQDSLDKQKKDALSGMSSFQRKKLSGENLTIDDLKKQVQNLAKSFTFISDPQAKKDNIEQRKILSEKIKIYEEEQKAKEKADKEESARIAKAGEKKLKDAEEQLKKQQEWDRKTKELQKEFPEFNKKINDDIKQSTLNRFDYSKYLLLQEKLDRIAKLNEMKAHHIDIKNAELLTDKAYNESLKKLNKEQKEAEAQDLEDTNKQKREQVDFLEDINKKILNENASKLDKDKENNKNALREIYKSYEDQKEKMSKAKDINGNKKFSAGDIQAFTNAFSILYKQLEAELNKNLEKKVLAESYIKQIDEIKEKLQDLGLEEDLLRGDRLDKEKAFWEEIKNTVSSALADTSKLTEEDKKKFEEQQKEINKNLAQNLRDKEKLSKDGMKAFAKATEDVFTNIGILDKNTASAFSNIITFENGAIEMTDNLSDAFQALQKNGLQGLMDFAKKGGDLSGILGFVNLMVNQAKGMFSAIADNLRKPESLQDFFDVANSIGEDFINVVTLGAVKGTKNLLGLKDNKALFEEQKSIRESNIKLSKDKEANLENNYQLQKDIINRTIKDEVQKNIKLKELDFDYTQQKFEIYKENADLDIKLTDDKIESIKKWYNLEKSTIENSEGNWDLRNKKLLLAQDDFTQKMAEANKAIEEMNIKLDNQDEITQSIRNANVKLSNISATVKNITDKEKQSTLVLIDLAEQLQKTKENGFKDIESIMSKYYEKEQQKIKDNHKIEYDLIQAKQKEIKINEDKINELDKYINDIEKKFNSLLEDKNLSKSSATAFSQMTQAFIQKNNGLDFTALINTPLTEFERRVTAKKTEIENAFSSTVDQATHAKSLQDLAIEEKVYYQNRKNNLVANTKEYDASRKAETDAFTNFKNATKESIEAQKSYEEQNYNVNGSIVNLKDSIEALTNKNKDLSSDINKYNSNIQTDLDRLTAKFKNSAGEWETDINKVRTTLQGMSSDARNAINELDKAIAKKQNAEAGLKQILVDTNAPINQSNINKNAFSGVNTTSNNNVLAPVSVGSNSVWKDQKAGESVDDYINRIKMEDAMAQQNFNGQSAFAKANDPFNSIQGIAPEEPKTKNWFENIVSSAANVFGFASGGISNGPNSGYFTKLHGKELVLNEGQGDNLSYLLRLANNPSSYTNNNSSSFIVNINGSTLNENQLQNAVVKAYRDIQRNERLSYA